MNEYHIDIYLGKLNATYTYNWWLKNTLLTLLVTKYNFWWLNITQICIWGQSIMWINFIHTRGGRYGLYQNTFRSQRNGLWMRLDLSLTVPVRIFPTTTGYWILFTVYDKPLTTENETANFQQVHTIKWDHVVGSI